MFVLLSINSIPYDCLNNWFIIKIIWLLLNLVCLLSYFNTILVNSLWPGDATRQHGTRSTLAQVMAWCLTAPSHYLTNVDLSSVRCHGIHLRALSLDDVKIPINKTKLKIAVLTWHPGLPGANFSLHYDIPPPLPVPYIDWTWFWLSLYLQMLCSKAISAHNAGYKHQWVYLAIRRYNFGVRSMHLGYR